MTDPIKQAISSAKSSLPNIPVPEVPDGVTEGINVKDKLPSVKNKELIKRQAEAKAQQAIADKKQEALELKEKAFKDSKTLAKNAVKSLAGTALASLPKPPITSQKILSSLALAKQLKEAVEERQMATVSNLTKNKELFTFPMALSPSITAVSANMPPSISSKISSTINELDQR